jgi:lysozyme family protein
MFGAAFEAAVAVTIDHEGGDKLVRDSGGLTKYGISQRAYPTEDIANLTLDRAKSIYFTDYWMRYRWYALPAGPIATKALDCGVDIGGQSMNRCLQRALRALGDAIDDDGVLGPVTESFAQRAPADALLAALKSEIAGHYRLTAQATPAEAGDLKGWLNRAYS